MTTWDNTFLKASNIPLVFIGLLEEGPEIIIHTLSSYSYCISSLYTSGSVRMIIQPCITLSLRESRKWSFSSWAYCHPEKKIRVVLTKKETIDYWLDRYHNTIRSVVWEADGTFQKKKTADRMQKGAQGLWPCTYSIRLCAIWPWLISLASTFAQLMPSLPTGVHVLKHATLSLL